MTARGIRSDARRTAKSKARPRRLADIAEETRAALRVAETGLACCIVRDQSLMLYARTIMQLHACGGIPIADVPVMETETMLALYGSGSHDANIAEVLARRNLNASSRADRVNVKRLPDCRIFNPLSNEGIHVTLSNLQTDGCVTAEQSIADIPRDQLIDAFGRLDAGGRERNGLVLLFLYCPPNTDASWMQLHCDEVFIVDKCEPGPGASTALSVTALSLESQHINGIGRMMYEVSHKGTGWTSTSSVFIAAKAEDRAIWQARREREYLQTIAGWMGGVDKATVKRRQDLMPLRTDIDADVDLPAGWRDEWFPFLGWEDCEDCGDADAADDEPEKRPKRLA